MINKENRMELAKKTHNMGEVLTPENATYKQWIFRYTFLELEKDLGEKGDITSAAVVPAEMRYPYQIIAKSDGILAGVQEIKYFLCDSDPNFRPRIGEIEIEFLKNDGDLVMTGEAVMTLNGNAQDILKVERTVLNLLQRMSGIATLARRFIDKAPDVLIVPTRKTLWGLLDKRACAIGGAGTHRLNLGDAILIKDTHLNLPGITVEGALNGAYAAAIKTRARFIEIEVENVEMGIKAVEAIKKIGDKEVRFVVMLDNMAPAKIKEFIDKYGNDGFLIEASGGINLENIEEYAKTGVDIISVGELTMGAKPMDFSMKVKA
ncbi:MAG: nicotinate-nucleotide pyrophosphorylase, nicotinate-nucleotide pyrophosphorylase (carboxylating) [Candidatus Peregrinibacteria bacterium GW2011_GWF2_38_29]|nr:MAG: nicotinate-nucleotide pyrophosphorylase, nicotinate-nucleotide pyrophosphorylase (carboxylating) [Candidatus Peregrinibacteria bacterium GW2011_GWF2_38_29]HBB02941.1 carboxylating nicotinate-nucleotide diphosphorylase [Candidatus Peregrinibacteria bacterium]